jgi:Rrf2 family transcriptional regulator, nitric oxide-sensitive transcriptional repressor
MRPDKQTGFSLRMLMFLAARTGRVSTIAKVAERCGIAQAHLMQVGHPLGRAGFVETVRGSSGGTRLAGDGTTIRVGDVLRRMEGEIGLMECHRSPGGRCPIAPCCRVLSKALAAFLTVLDGYTISDIPRNNDALADLLWERAT